MKKYKKVYIEITNVCNLECSFCPGTERRLGYMTKEQFLHVIKEIKPYTDYVYFHLMGEPLLNPELEGFIAICAANDIKVNLTTNGTLLEKNKTKLLNSPGLRKVSISLHSFEANPEGITLEEYLGDTINFVKEASAKGIICEFRLWNAGKEGIGAGNSLNGVIIKALDLAFAAEAENGEAEPKPDLYNKLVLRQNTKLADKVFLHLAQRFEWPDIDRADQAEAVFCYGLRDQFGILVDGTVVPCCLDSEGGIPLGNIFEQPLRDILESPRACRMYGGFTARTAVEELCRRCGYAERHKR
jgi:MoaA/NifB/PqqE/SkfB family radical SAM enzyme